MESSELVQKLAPNDDRLITLLTVIFALKKTVKSVKNVHLNFGVLFPTGHSDLSNVVRALPV